jgi:hypothetical protein
MFSWRENIKKHKYLKLQNILYIYGEREREREREREERGKERNGALVIYSSSISLQNQ